MSNVLEELERLKGLLCLSEKDYDYIVKTLEEHEMLKNLVVKMFGENGLDLETWAHLDKSNTYHIVYTNSYEHLDIPISKEDYDFLGGLYGKKTS